MKTEALGDITNVSWGNTSITKASYVESGVLAYSAAGPDGRLPKAEHRGPGLVVSAIGSVGNVYLAEGEWTAIKNTITVTPRGGHDVDFKFLFYFLSRKGIWRARGGTQQFIGLGTAREVKVTLPPLSEQRRIAAVLDKADELRAKRHGALAELETLTQSIFLEMFGDPIVNRAGLPIVRMGDVCDVRDGTHDSPKYITHGGFPLVTSKNLSGGRLDMSDVNLISEVDYERINKRSKVDRGDIIMPMIGTIGSPVIVEEEPRFAIKNVALIKFKEESPSPIFVQHILSCHYFDHIVGQKNRGGTQKFVSLGDLRAFPLPLPPVAGQRDFVRRVAAVEDLKARHRTALAELDDLFASLQHRAFRGQL